MALNMKAAAAAAMEAGQPEKEEIPPEMMAVIAAAVTAFLGANLRIRSARLLQSPDAAVSRWTQQGRASVLASHNLPSKR
ncbi:MAG: hypothetical protein ABSG62_05685 [Terracidiphilus sp.]